MIAKTVVRLSCLAAPRRTRIRLPLRTHRLACPRAFSLLEVILALAILTGAVAVLGEIARLSLRNAQIARDLAQAQLLCESKLAEVIAGITAAEPIQFAPVESLSLDSQLSATAQSDRVPWLYSIGVEATDEDGVVAIRVSVTQDLPVEQHPVECTLVRWIPDPGLELSESSESSDSTSSSSSSSGGSSSE